MVFSIAFRIVGDEEEARDMFRNNGKVMAEVTGIKDTEKFQIVDVQDHG